MSNAETLCRDNSLSLSRRAETTGDEHVDNRGETCVQCYRVFTAGSKL